MSCLPSGKRGNNQHSLFPNGFCLWNVRAGMFGATIDGAEDKRAVFWPAEDNRPNRCPERSNV